MLAKIIGGQIPRGRIRISGAKNSATRIMAGSLLCDGEVLLSNFPCQLEDVKNKASFIRSIGVDVSLNNSEDLALITTNNIDFTRAHSFDLEVRTTYLMAAAGLLRKGKAFIPYPGGCKLGARGYDLHIYIWEKMGCSVVERKKYIEVSGNLAGADIDFPYRTVGGTENAILCAVVASGKTTIHNAYITPEVNDLIKFLKSAGARIKIEGTSHIEIIGRDGLLDKTRFRIMPDRLEGLTWVIFSAITGGKILLEEFPYNELSIPLLHLKEAGIDIFRNDSSAIIDPKCIGKHGIQSFEVACGVHPGVHTDMQPFFVLLALFGAGISVVHDYRYPKRIEYAKQLLKMSPGNIEIAEGIIKIIGRHELKAADLESTDLRGSMAMLLAAFMASGESTVHKVEMALRGYNNLQEKFKDLGLECVWI